MKISFYNGVSGMIAYQEQMDRVAHNIANANTAGFKAIRSGFSELLYTKMAVNSEEEPLTGHGVKIGGAQLAYRQAPVIQTGNETDLALMGDGFFALQRPDGGVEYTRCGAFHISIEGGKGFLAAEDGSHVLDSRGRPVELERDGRSGPFDLSDLAERPGIYDFPNPYGLQHSGGGCFYQSETSGEAVAVSLGEGENGRSYRVIQSALEQSGTELSDEMVQVITAQRAFALNARMVQTADELEQVVNNLR